MVKPRCRSSRSHVVGGMKGLVMRLRCLCEDYSLRISSRRFSLPARFAWSSSESRRRLVNLESGDALPAARYVSAGVRA